MHEATRNTQNLPFDRNAHALAALKAALDRYDVAWQELRNRSFVDTGVDEWDRANRAADTVLHELVGVVRFYVGEVST